MDICWIILIGFIIAMIFSYKRDKILHQKFYKGSYKVLIGFVLFILILFFIKFYLKD